MLGFRAKRFGEQYHHMQQRRRSASKSSLLKNSNGSLSGLDDETTDSLHHSNNSKNLQIFFDLGAGRGATRSSESENDDDCKKLLNFLIYFFNI